MENSMDYDLMAKCQKPAFLAHQIGIFLDFTHVRYTHYYNSDLIWRTVSR